MLETQQPQEAVSASIFQSSLPVEVKLERARTELLDLSARNRLLNIPRSAKSARTLEIVDERSDEVFRLLVAAARPFTFLAGKAAAGAEPSEGDEIADLAQPDDDGMDERGVSNRHADTRLQTRLTTAGLQKKLLDLYADARTLEEEQGVNILFLALGTLKWIDPKDATNIRYAPLVLVPVALERGNAAEKFKLRWRHEDVAANLSLEAFLNRVHELRLPTFEADDAFKPSTYAAAVAEAVAAKPGWSVQPDDIILGFFSFAKFLMYRDLDAGVWPAQFKITEQPLIRSLLSDGFDGADDLISEEEQIDARITPGEMLHIVDSDSSQSLAVHEVRRSKNLVIQGPPGTGKSQTIANIIASAVADGKTVLFVAEKMAALEVVKRRLDATGVGDACLELHSNKANKRDVVKELDRTWQLGAPKGEEPDALIQRLTEARDRLNAHVDRMHHPHQPSRLSPYEVAGQLARLCRGGEHRGLDIALPQAVHWGPEDYRTRHALLQELTERIDDIGPPVRHSWYGVGLGPLTPMERDRLLGPLPTLAQSLGAVTDGARELAQILEIDSPSALAQIDGLKLLADRIAGAPDLSSVALASAAWERRAQEIDALLEAGRACTDRVTALLGLVSDEGWTTDAVPLHEALAELPDTFSPTDFADAKAIASKIPDLVADAALLAEALGTPPATTFKGMDRLTRVAERVAAAPPASPEIFAAELWVDGVERAGDLAEAVAKLEEARAQIGNRLSEGAWSLDLASARATLATHGSGLFRFLNGQWRSADRLVRSVLADPKLPLGELLPLLDALSRGQGAQREIREGEGFGAKAFGSSWRGERSTAAPLRALVAWMRSLSDLGAEPRLIAARRPDQEALRERGERLTARFSSVRQDMERLWRGVGSAAPQIFGNVEGPVHSEPSQLLAKFTAITEADVGCRRVLIATPEDVPTRRRRLTLLVEAREASAAVKSGNMLGQEAFDDAWKGLDSDWTVLTAASVWQQANGDIRTLASRVPDRSAAASTASALVQKRDALVTGLVAICNALKLDRVSAFEGDDLAQLPIERIAGRLERWLAEPEALSNWVGYRDRALQARAQNLGDFVEQLEQGSLDTSKAISLFEMSVFEAVLNDMVRLDPEIGRFSGFLHNRLVSEFADLDLQRIAQARLEVVRAHHRRIPPVHGGAVGPLGVLRGEIARKRGHMPIRQLMEKAAPAVQALKPVVMMSPLSVAQYLPPGTLHFDLLVMDEASQIQPVDALGAIARCKQVVVVGDPQQLPPTAFFSKMTGAVEEDDEDDAAKVADIESILGLFTARGLPKRMLRWHYRSRHQSLIAVSNSQFYESKLFIVPSPYSHEAGMGLRFHHVADGVFDTGKTRTNAVEAKVVAQAIVDHAINHPEESLGVAAFSSQQRRAIQDQLEIHRRGLAPEHEAFFQRHPTEPFFVKNLENVQGDERDVIFISVGYAASTPGGKPPMRFGPLGMAGGDRRLNVLISRAKRRCEVFSSITDEDIDPDFAISRKGVFAFRLFLHFARTGRLSLLETSDSDRVGVLETEVAVALQARGYQVHRNVGIAGLFVDLAVADPERQGRYILGIECDGPSYRAGRSARDRDRIRRTVLEDHGWTMHRLWSVDWFQRPGEELERIVACIEGAKAKLATRDTEPVRQVRAVPAEFVFIEREDVTEIGLVGVEDRAATFVGPYQEATLTRPPLAPDEIHLTPAGTLIHLAEQVVRREGPVHIDEVTARIRDAWGAGRAGGRIRDSVERAVSTAIAQGGIIREDGFLWAADCAHAVRDRSEVRSAGLRKPEMLPPTELRTAILQIVRANFGATPDQVAQSVSRELGFKATSAQLRFVIDRAIERAQMAEELVRQDDLLILGPAAELPEPPSLAAEALLTLIARGESEKLEFKQTLRFDIETQSVNRKLEDVVIKTIAGFANQSGGALLIGVCDDGRIAGLEPDYSTLGPGNRDKFELHLTHLLNSHFGQAFRGARVRVSFPVANGKAICKVDVSRSPTAVVVKLADRAGASIERFYVRMGNSTHDLSLSQMSAFIANRVR